MRQQSNKTAGHKHFVKFKGMSSGDRVEFLKGEAGQRRLDPAGEPWIEGDSSHPNSSSQDSFPRGNSYQGNSHRGSTRPNSSYQGSSSQGSSYEGNSHQDRYEGRPQDAALPESECGYDTLLKVEGDPEAIQKAHEEFHKHRSRVEGVQRKEWSAAVAKWRKEAESDPEIGGDNLPLVIARAQSALDRFDPDKRISEWLVHSGYGNHPDVLRFFNRIAEGMGEDALVQGRPRVERKPLEERMYPNWNP